MTQKKGDREMAINTQELEIEKEKGMSFADEIERSESYLVSCMFTEASLLASSIINNLRQCCVESDELYDMLEAAGMVLVQSLKESGRTSEILKELKLLFGSVTTIPAQVFFTGVCFQISEDPSIDVQLYIDDYLGKWSYKDGYYISAEPNVFIREDPNKRFALDVDQYIEVIELYVITFLGVLQRDMDLAISWIEKAALPEEKRQELLRRLHSINALATTGSSQPSLSSHKGEHGVTPTSTKENKTYTEGLKDLASEHLSNKQASTKEAILKLSGQRVQSFWWFKKITLKFGSKKVVLSNLNILLGGFLLFMCYLIQRKRASLKRVLKKQALWVKKGLVDLWQLAFSYQVNPLAAVQSLPAAAPGSR